MNLLRPLGRYVLVNGLRLHALDWGGDGRTPLLLLHGFTGHAHAWDTLSIALQPHFHVYAPTAGGCGSGIPASRSANLSRTSIGGPSCEPSRGRPWCCAGREATCSTGTSPSEWPRSCRTADSSRSHAQVTPCTRTTPRRSSPR